MTLSDRNFIRLTSKHTSFGISDGATQTLRMSGVRRLETDRSRTDKVSAVFIWSDFTGWLRWSGRSSPTNGPSLRREEESYLVWRSVERHLSFGSAWCKVNRCRPSSWRNFFVWVVWEEPSKDPLDNTTRNATPATGSCVADVWLKWKGCPWRAKDRVSN
jgi:hypothetical protein